MLEHSRITLEVSDWGTVDELAASATQKGTHGLGLETSKFTAATSSAGCC